MLERIREFAWERLEARNTGTGGEAADARRRHAVYYLALAERAAPGLDGPEQVAWLNRLEAEHNNLRAALGWTMETGAAEHGLRLAGAVGWFWWVRGYLSEGREWLDRLLALPGAQEPSLARAGALDAAGFLAFQQGAYAAAEALHREALGIREARRDGRGLRHSLHGLGDARMMQGDRGAAGTVFERGLANARELGDIWGEALFSLHLAMATGDRDRARSRALYERALALARETGNAWGIAYATGGLARLALDKGDTAAAGALSRDSMALLHDVGDRFGLLVGLHALAVVAAARGHHARVLRLAGAGAALQQIAGSVIPPPQQRLVECQVAAARQALGAAAPAAWAEGCAMSWEEAIAYALAPGDSPAAPVPRGTPAPTELSPREREVAALVARGLTNREVAEALVISEGTARVHVAHILAKLGVRSRVQVAAWAAAQHGQHGHDDRPAPAAESMGRG